MPSELILAAMNAASSKLLMQQPCVHAYDPNMLFESTFSFYCINIDVQLDCINVLVAVMWSVKSDSDQN